MKRCMKCLQTKEMTDFQPRGDGYRGVCRKCDNARKSAWHWENIDRERESARIRRANELGLHPDDYAPRAPMSPEARILRKREGARGYYLRNRDKCLAREKARAEALTLEECEERRAYRRGWGVENSERKRTSDREWRERNPHKISEYSRDKRLRKQRAMPEWLNEFQKAQILEAYDIAKARSVQTGVPHEVDHIVPLGGKEACGLHVPWNLRVVPRSENRSKGNRMDAV